MCQALVVGMSSFKWVDRTIEELNAPGESHPRVAVIGVGILGSYISIRLAYEGIGSQRLVDCNLLKPEDLPWYPLGKKYKWENRAEGVARYLTEERGNPDIRALPWIIDDAVCDRDLDRALASIDLVVAATGDPKLQARLAKRSLARGIPALFPSITGPTAGQVFVQRDRHEPCFFCWQPDYDQSVEPIAVEKLDRALSPILAGVAVGRAVTLIYDDVMKLPLHDFLARFEPQLRLVRVENGQVTRHGRMVDKRDDCPLCYGVRQQTMPPAQLGLSNLSNLLPGFSPMKWE